MSRPWEPRWWDIGGSLDHVVDALRTAQGMRKAVDKIVGEALVDYVKDGSLWISSFEKRGPIAVEFYAGDDAGRLIKKARIGKLVRDWIEAGHVAVLDDAPKALVFAAELESAAALIRKTVAELPPDEATEGAK